MKNNLDGLQGRLVLRGVPKMTRREKQRIAAWLRAQAEHVLREPLEIASTYTARIYGGKKV